MNVEHSSQPGVRLPRLMRWVAWMLVILMGGTFLVAVVAAFVTDTVDGLDTRKLPVLLAIVFVAAIIAWLKCGFNPIRRRTDHMNRWRQLFPAQNEQEIRAFLQVVSKALLLGTKHNCKFSPDDRMQDLSRAFGGDGLEIVEMLMAVEWAYALDLPDSFLETNETLGTLFDYVTQHGIVRPMSAATGLYDSPERG